MKQLKWREILIAAVISVFASVIVTHAVSPPFSEAWTPAYEAIPADTEAESLGASRIRDLKTQLRLRLSQDLSWAGNGNDGYSNQVTLLQQSADPTPNFDVGATGGFLYTKLVGTNDELFYKDSTGNVIQLTNQGVLTALAPSGTVTFYAGASTLPPGWIACDGSVYANTTYPNLAAALGNTYGGSAGSTFAVPDVRARFIAGYDPSNATGRLTANVPSGISAISPGQTGGLQDAQLAINNIPPLPINVSVSGSGSATLPTGPYGNGGIGTSGSSASYMGSGISAPGIGVSLSLSASASISGTAGNAFNNVPPAIIMQCMIKT